MSLFIQAVWIRMYFLCIELISWCSHRGYYCELPFWMMRNTLVIHIETRRQPILTTVWATGHRPAPLKKLKVEFPAQRYFSSPTSITFKRHIWAFIKNILIFKASNVKIQVKQIQRFAGKRITFIRQKLFTTVKRLGLFNRFFFVQYFRPGSKPMLCNAIQSLI